MDKNDLSELSVTQCEIRQAPGPLKSGFWRDQHQRLLPSVLPSHGEALGRDRTVLVSIPNDSDLLQMGKTPVLPVPNLLKSWFS
jgi:hypothetical protein